MRVIVAPDSFKGSISAVGAANAMERGIQKIYPEAQVTKVPIADGGEGTVQALVMATKGKYVYETVVGPLGDKVSAAWGMLGDGKTAIIEMAAASGLTLVPKEKLNPAITTTYGTGQLIRAVLDHGISRIIIGIGGSATNDGGMGMLQALGIRFLDEMGRDLPAGGLALAGLRRIDLTTADTRLQKAEIIVACDVDNPLCGPRGASFVYGPQKGADQATAGQLDQALSQYAGIAKHATGRDVACIPGAGAAGGMGAAFLWFTNATLQPGIQVILDAVRFDELVAHANLILTGEGCTDSQTAYGKAPVGVAKYAKKYHKPVICISGAWQDGAEVLEQHGIDALFSTVPRPMKLEECMAESARFIEFSTQQVCQVLKIGSNFIY